MRKLMVLIMAALVMFLAIGCATLPKGSPQDRIIQEVRIIDKDGNEFDRPLMPGDLFTISAIVKGDATSMIMTMYLSDDDQLLYFTTVNRSVADVNEITPGIWIVDIKLRIPDHMEVGKYIVLLVVVDTTTNKVEDVTVTFDVMKNVA